MAEPFKVIVDVKSKGRIIATDQAELSSRKNLMAVVKRLFPELEIRLDKTFGAELSGIAGLRKSKKAGLHFTIDDRVPVGIDPFTHKKLYLSLYHVQADKDMHVVIELVSISCEYPNSVIDPRLKLRYGSEGYWLEKLPQPGKKEPIYSYSPALPASPYVDFGSAFGSDYFRYQLSQNMRNFGGRKRKPREPDFPGIRVQDALFVSASGRPAALEEYSLQIAGIILPVPWDLLPSSPSMQRVFQHQKETLLDTGFGAPISEPIFTADTKQLAMEGVAIGLAHWENSVESSQKPRHTDSRQPRMATHAPTQVEDQKTKSKSVAKAIPISSIKNFKAAIFDLDGVLVDSEKAHLETFRQAFSKFGIEISPSYWRRNYTGIGSRAIVEDLFRKNGIKEPVQAMVGQRADIYQKYVAKNGLPAIPGATKALELVRSEGIKAIVASGGHRTHITASLKSIGVQGMQFVGHEDVKNHKPSPDTFLLAAEKLCVKPSECIVFEDSLSGIQAAASAGMACVALSTTLPASQLRGKAAMVAKDFRSARLRKALARLVAKRKKETRRQKTPGAPAKKRRGKKLRRPVLVRLV